MSELSADELVRLVDETGLLGGGEPVLLLCSAGRDSHCLLDVAVRLRGAAGVRVLHVDHGLRDGSAAEATQMRERCAALGVAMVVRDAGPRPGGNSRHADYDSAALTPDREVPIARHGAVPIGEEAAVPIGEEAAMPIGEEAAMPIGNLHAWAREARRRLAAEERARVGARVVATAHTRSDLVETALGRFATQPGRRALLSMRASEPLVAPAGLLVRPLLGVSRDATGAYCRARGITWRDDPSNADPKYARARLRHSVVPVLRSLNPRAEEAITRTLAELTEESEVLDALVAAELSAEPVGDPARTQAVGVAAPGPDAPHAGAGPTIELTRLAQLPPALARLVLRTLCERTLGMPAARAGARLDEVLALGPAAARNGSAAIDVGGGARLELRHGWVRCVPSEGSAARQPL